VRTCQCLKTTPGRLGARVIAPIRVAFRHRNDVGTQDEGTFAAQWLAYGSPVNASPIPSRVLAHDSGSIRGRYSFIVMDLHHTPCRSSRRTPLYPYQRTSPESVMSQRCHKRKSLDGVVLPPWRS
jgi:hypothetical protein